MPEAGFIDYAVSPISAFTKQAIYYPDRDTTCRFTVSRQAKYTFDLKIIYPRLANFISRQKDSVLYISTGDYFEVGKGKMIDSIQFTPIASFYGSVVPDEYYILYIAKKIDINKLMRDSNSFRNPKTLSTMMDLTNTLLQAGKLDRAEKILLTVQEKTQGKPVPSLHNYLGQIYSQKNMRVEAKKEFRTEIALNLEKENAFFNLGMLYYRNKDYNNAIIFWDSTIHINPKNSDALNNLGVCYLNYKNDNNQAKLYFEKALEINPDYKEGYYSLLICAQNTNDEKLFIKYIRILLSKGVSLKDIQARGIKVSDELLQKINSN
jgi:tetratricopeptide (TPR) repeat protein